MRVLALLVKSLTALALLATVAVIVLYIRWNPQPDAEQAYINGRILTMNQNNQISEAMLVRDNRIVAVGSTNDIKAQMSKPDTIVDLNGKTLMPGFIDAHGHFPGSGLAALAADLNSPPIGKITTAAAALAKIKMHADATPKGEWIYAYGFDDTQITEQRFLSREELDSVSTEHPIYVSHVSGHMGVANSFAFNLVGYDRNTPDPSGGHIAHDKEGNLAGLVEENAQTPLVTKALDLSTLQFYKMSSHANEEYLRKGVTSAQSGLASPALIQGLSSLGKLGFYPLRITLWPDLESAEMIVEGKLSKTNIESDRIKVGALKLVTDGSIQGFTGFLGHSYHTIPEGKAEDYAGYPTMSQTELTSTVEKFHSLGWQIAMHGNGDAAIDQIIKAYASAQAKHPREDARPIIIHAQMTRDDQLDQFAALNMSPSFFNSHVYYWGDRHKAIFMGPERAARMSPMNSALERNIPFTLHLDTPIVPMTPLLAAWSAVTRETSGGEVLGVDQAISPIQALRAQTIDAAWQIFAEKDRGSLEAGKLADFIILDRDPLSSTEALRDAQVLRTVVGGVVRYTQDF